MDNMSFKFSQQVRCFQKGSINQNLCNCRNPGNKCLTSKIVYSAEIITDDEQLSKFYLGICGTEFKTGFNNHKKCFRHRENEKVTELSKYIWELKGKHTEYEIRWSIARISSGFNPVSKSCNLCLLEKLLLYNFSDKSRLINKRLDLASKCRHENKYMLKNYYGVKKF